MSSLDAKKVEDAIGSLAGALSVLEGGSKTEISREKQQQDNPIEKSTNASGSKNIKKLKEALSAINEMMQSQAKEKATLEESQNGFIIQLPAAMLFKPDSATINNDDALLFLRRIALIIKKMPKNISIDAIGHSDANPPSKTSKFSDNWELSTARAVSVVAELIKANVNPKRLIASGKSQYDPVATNATEEGRAKNRRVSLHFYASSKDDKKAKQTVLDMQKNIK